MAVLPVQQHGSMIQSVSPFVFSHHFKAVSARVHPKAKIVRASFMTILVLVHVRLMWPQQ